MFDVYFRWGVEVLKEVLPTHIHIYIMLKHEQPTILEVLSMLSLFSIIGPSFHVMNFATITTEDFRRIPLPPLQL